MNTVKGHVYQNLLRNYEITADNINRGELIYSPLELYVEGHIVRHKPLINNKIEKIPLPSIILEHHLDLALCMDFFFTNRNIFLYTKTNKVNFLTV